MNDSTVEIVKWNTEQVKAAVAAKLMANAPDAAHFIEEDARRRLKNIKSPDTPRDVNYRFYLLRYILTSVVEKVSDSGFVIAIGMKIGKDGQRHHGWWIEKGSSTAPAHPYLVPSILQNKADIIRMLLGD